MIRNSSKRMSVAQLKQQMDRRFDALDKRFEAVDRRFDAIEGQMRAGFESLHNKLNSMFRRLDHKFDHHQTIVDVYEDRLQELEAWRRRRSGPAR